MGRTVVGPHRCGRQRTLATEVNASEFYLWSSIRNGVDWSISPAGLSSNSYDGHIFWDAETWMYPALLAQHPDLATGMNDYRFHAACGRKGPCRPRPAIWVAAIPGKARSTAQSKSPHRRPCSRRASTSNTSPRTSPSLSGSTTKRRATRRWLEQRGWPVISQAASFWASRAVPGAGSTYHIGGVTGPDEENPDVNDEVYTNAAAVTTLRDAIQAAGVVGLQAPADWTRIASGIVVPVDSSLGISPEFAGYGGQRIKQADASLLEYPLGYGIPPNIALGNVVLLRARTDPNGPSMSDAINSIDSSALGTGGCASFVYTQRSVQPFMRDVFEQFSETRGGGALTFMTGIGGFLQEFLYGYSGLRWDSNAVDLSPSITGQLGGVVLHGLSWHGRRFTVAIGQHTTAITVDSDGILPVKTGSTTHHVGSGRTLVVVTRRPDLAHTTDTVRCG